MAFSWPVGRLSCTAKGAARGFLLECPQFVVAEPIYPLHRQQGENRSLFIPSGSDFHPPNRFTLPQLSSLPRQLLGRARLAFQATLSRTYLFHHTVPSAYCRALRLGRTCPYVAGLPASRGRDRRPQIGALCPRSTANSSIILSDVAFSSRSSPPSLSLSWRAAS